MKINTTEIGEVFDTMGVKYSHSITPFLGGETHHYLATEKINGIIVNYKLVVRRSFTVSSNNNKPYLKSKLKMKTNCSFQDNEIIIKSRNWKCLYRQKYKIIGCAEDSVKIKTFNFNGIFKISNGFIAIQHDKTECIILSQFDFFSEIFFHEFRQVLEDLVTICR